MRRNLRLLSGLLLLLPVLLTTTSCSPERRLARQFIEQKPQPVVLLIAPDYIYKSGYKLPDSIDISKLSDEAADSVLFFNTKLLKFLKDSAFIESYSSGFAGGLKSVGINLFQAENAEDFINFGKDAQIVNIAQIQLEEYYDSIADEAGFSEDENYLYNVFVTAVNVNSWIEVTRTNKPELGKKVLYRSSTVNDYVDGGFEYFPLSGDVKYQYTVDSLTVDDLYLLAGHIGNLNATYFYDHLLNEFVARNMPQGEMVRYFFSYDRISGTLRKTYSKGFTELE